MKKTDNFNNMVEELFKSIFGDEIQFSTCCTEQDNEEEKTECKCGHCKTDEPKPVKQVFEWTDDDFTSEEAVTEYCDQLDSLVSKFKNIDSLFNVSKLFDFDFAEYVESLKEHAWDVYDEYVEDNTPESLDEDDEPEVESNTTQNLAQRYVDEVIASKFKSLDCVLDEKTKKQLVSSYKEFADWVLDQH